MYFDLMMKVKSVFQQLFLKKITKPRFGSQGLLITGHEAEPLRGTNPSAYVQ